MSIRSGRQPQQLARRTRSRARQVAGVQLEVDTTRARPSCAGSEPDLVQLRDDRRLVAALADALLEARERRDLGQRVARRPRSSARWTKLTPSSSRNVA